MFIDARELPGQSRLQCDLAIIGAGPAGISLARALAGSGTDICLIEAGGLQADAATQALYQGESVGLDYPLAASRLRYFGGSSNHWGGYCRPLDAIDFEARDWVPNSGWPFTIDTLRRYYTEADRLVEVAPGHYADTGYWERVTGERLPRPVTGRMKLQFLHFSPPTRFGERYREELSKADGLRVLLNANVTRIAARDDGGSISHLDIRTLDGPAHRVEAGTFVLATGGLENARLLLLSNDVMRTGLGNRNDRVGRYFMEHVHPRGFAEMVVADLQRLPRLFRERVGAEGRTAQVAFNPSTAYLRRQRLLNATFMVGVAGRYPADVTPGNDDPRARDHLDMLGAARHFLADAAATGDGAWLGMGGSCEQVPNPNSRVSLATRRDVLGLPMIRLDWRLTDQDRHSFFTHLQSLALEFGALGLARTRRIGDDDWPEPVAGGSHHMGTTRMHDDPRQGVVDSDCRVHGIDNLYVAGSSVFPTSGVANPTLTLLALALRLADHLRERLR